jgi:hypothetical protein
VVAGASLAERIWANPFAALPGVPVTGAPHRVRGRVHSGGRGLRRVGVSDGLQAVDTDAEGRFELLRTADRPFVQLTVPAGHRIPVSATGTARAYAPLSAGGETEVEFALERLESAEDHHTLLLLADTQTQTAEEMRWLHERTVPDVQATVASLGGEVFGIADGDIMYDDLALYPEYERAVSRMGVPFFQVVGNHDLDFGASDVASTSTFRSRFGPTWYSFDRGAVHYVVLDDVFWHGRGYIGYLTHEQVSGTVCGAWWSGPICWDGTPCGYSVYEMRGEQVTWRYKATGHDAEHQMRLYRRGADPTAPGEIVANVWNWDPEWQVVWYENGERRGPMARRLGRDPLSVELHSGADHPPHRPWVEPRPTGHLFYAPVPLDAGEIMVQATDRFGRSYRAIL